MIWIDHSRDFPEGSHSLFSPSQSAWIDYETEEDVFKKYRSSVAAQIGTVVHKRAEICIDKKVRPTKKTASQIITMDLLEENISRTAFDPDFLAANLVNFVNDALGYGMLPEKPLVYSEWLRGTADAIMYDETKRILRIHDLKTGVIPAKFKQLRAYAALFFLEYSTLRHVIPVTPGDVRIELRIYQNGEVTEEYPTAEDIVPIMDKIVWINGVMQSIEKG